MTAKSPGGFTMIEVVVAGALLGIATLLLISQFRYGAIQVTQASDTSAIQQIEKGVRDKLAGSLRYFSTRNCTVPPQDDFTQIKFMPWIESVQLGLGIQLTDINNALQTGLNQQWSSNAPLWGAMNAVINRCLTSSTSARPQDWQMGSYNTQAGWQFTGPSALRGIYFCNQISANPGAGGVMVGGDSIMSMQRILAEFYYTNISVSSGLETACSAFSANWAAHAETSPWGGATMGMLIYTFYWVSNRGGNYVFERYSGMVALGNDQ